MTMMPPESPRKLIGAGQGRRSNSKLRGIPSPMPTRPKLPSAVEASILLRSKRRCCLCVYLSSDSSQKRGQIAHLDGNPANNNEDNLAFLCLEHHDQYDSRTSVSKGLTIGEVKRHRRALYDAQSLRDTPSASSARTGRHDSKTKPGHVDMRESLRWGWNHIRWGLLLDEFRQHFPRASKDDGGAFVTNEGKEVHPDLAYFVATHCHVRVSRHPR